MYMKDEINVRCPYCSNHCLLTNTKCHKEKELAAALTAGKKIEVNNESVVKDISALASDEKLLKLLCRCAVSVCRKNSYQLLHLLLLNGNMKEEIVLKKMNIKSSELKKLAHKLVKKGLIHRFHIDKSKRYQLVLSKDGIEKAKKLELKYVKQILEYFQALDEFQKQQLELLLEILIKQNEKVKT